MLNQCVVIGRLTKDPELRHTSNDTSVTNFTLAVNRPFKGKDDIDADFIPIVVWKGLAENCVKYLGKGSLCAVVGRLQIRSYQDADGNNKKMAEIVAENVRFLDGAKKNQEENEEEYDPLEGEELSDEDVPF